MIIIKCCWVYVVWVDFILNLMENVSIHFMIYRVLNNLVIQSTHLFVIYYNNNVI